MQEYNFTVWHQPGRVHNNADGLSRLATPQVVDLVDEPLVGWTHTEKKNTTVAVRRCHPQAVLPTRATQGAAGYDLACAIEFDLAPHECAKVATGWALQMEPPMVALIRERSSLGLRHIAVRGGIIDADFRGEVQVLMHNLTPEPLHFEAGDRIAQLLFQEYASPELCEATTLDPTPRGSAGFGST
ncbi:dUTPase-like protein, partial [Dimargaris cristalligena]